MSGAERVAVGQSQTDLTSQMARLRKLAVENGLYDADDWLVAHFPWTNRQGKPPKGTDCGCGMGDECQWDDYAR